VPISNQVISIALSPRVFRQTVGFGVINIPVLACGGAANSSAALSRSSFIGSKGLISVTLLEFPIPSASLCSLADRATLGFAISRVTSAIVSLSDCFLLFVLPISENVMSTNQITVNMEQLGRDRSVFAQFIATEAQSGCGSDGVGQCKLAFPSWNTAACENCLLRLPCPFKPKLDHQEGTAGFMARPYIWVERITTLSDHRKKPYR
jgi:hypothetical protein